MLQPESEFNRLAKEANDALDAQDFDRLEFFALQMRTMDPTDPTGWSYLGAVLSERGQHAGALDLHRNAITYGRDSSMAWSNYGLALLLAGEHQASVAALRNARDLNPQDSQLWRLLLQSLCLMGEMNDATETLKEIRLRFPGEIVGIVVRQLTVADHTYTISGRLVVAIEDNDESDFCLSAPDLNFEGYGDSLAEAWEDMTQTFHAIFVDYGSRSFDVEDPAVQKHVRTRLQEMDEATAEFEDDDELTDALRDTAPAVPLEQLRGA